MHILNSKYLLLLVFPLLLLSWGVAFWVASEPLFPDQQLEAAIRAEINFERGEIRADQLIGIESLTIRNAEIKNLEGLQHMPSLVALDLRSNNIDNIDVFTEMPQLEALDLRNNSIADISALRQLTQLTELDLRGNYIQNIEPLQSLTQLEELNLRSNSINNIDPLAALKTLQSLNIRDNHIEDISALSYLRNLEDLNMRNNDVTSIEPLRHLPNLRKRLYVDGNPILDFSPIEYLDQIEETDIEESNIIPIFSHNGGLYEDEIELEITSPLSEGTIFFTLNGSEPDPINNAEHTFEYSQPITIKDRSSEPNQFANIPSNYLEEGARAWQQPSDNIDKATVIRAKIVDNKSSFTSEVTTHTFFIGKSYSLPVVSITTDPSHFFDDETGIYVPGVAFDETADNPDGTGNYENRGREWERLVHIEFYEESGELAFAQPAGARIHGGFTRRFPQKSLRLYSRSDYGVSRFNYQLFPDKDLDDYNRFILRNSGNDWNQTMFRDAAMQSLVRHLDLDTQYYRPTVVFINGEYWGIHNVRDRYDVHYLETHYGGHRDNYTILVGKGLVDKGSPAGQSHYEDMLRYIEDNNLSKHTHYEYIKTLMDVDNYIQYYITQIYSANTDWPHNNIRFWRYNGSTDNTTDSDKLDGRWRWMVFDVDRSLGFIDPDFNMVQWTTSELSPERELEWPNFLFRGLLENESFTNQFINEMADHLNTTFHPERVSETINEHQALIEAEMPNHSDRWGSSVRFWQYKVNEMHRFAEVRPNYVRSHMINHFGLSGVANVTVHNDLVEGTIQINSIIVDNSTPGIKQAEEWTGKYFKDIPITITALPADGYEFVGWGELSDETTDSIEVVLSEDIVIQPQFRKKQ